MRIRHGLTLDEPDDFDLVTQDAALDVWEQVSQATFLALVTISSIALMVGGIGVMAIMTISVTERTREIGLRKALGARRKDVLLQFLAEAAGICLLGGVIGLLIATAGMYGLRKFIPATMSPQIILIALGVATATGLISGFLPAWRAARMNPVDALRSE